MLRIMSLEHTDCLKIKTTQKMIVFAQMTTSALFLIFFLLGPSLSEDTVEEDLGSHQLHRLVDLLTVHECEELLMTLSNPEEHIFNRLNRLSEETNQFKLPSRTPRDTDKESHCYPALIDWLKTHGEQMYYDRLSHNLQQIGRTDIAVEMGKNINQDKTLAMQRYVEKYHEQVNKMASHLTRSQTEETSHKETHHSAKQVTPITLWHNALLVRNSLSNPASLREATHPPCTYRLPSSWKFHGPCHRQEAQHTHTPTSTHLKNSCY